MRRLAPLLAGLLLVAGCGGAESAGGPQKDEPVDAATTSLFPYDPAQPLDVTEGETVDDIAYSIVGMSYGAASTGSAESSSGRACPVRVRRA